MSPQLIRPFRVWELHLQELPPLPRCPSLPCGCVSVFCFRVHPCARVCMYSTGKARDSSLSPGGGASKGAHFGWLSTVTQRHAHPLPKLARWLPL